MYGTTWVKLYPESITRHDELAPRIYDFEKHLNVIQLIHTFK